MVDFTITRKFAVDIDPSVFDDVADIINYIMKDLKNKSEIFIPELFKNKGRNSAKRVYDLYKAHLNEHNLKIPFGYLDRLYRCLFTYAYFNIRHYHRKRRMLQSATTSLLPLPWWENLEEIKIKFVDVSKVKIEETNDVKRQYRNLIVKGLKDYPFINDIEKEFEEFIEHYQPEFEDYNQLVLTFKQQLGKYLENTRKILKKKSDKRGWVVDLIRIIDKGKWKNDKKIWRKKQNIELDKLQSEQFLNGFSLSRELPSYNEIINHLVFPKKAIGRLTSGSVAGFKEFIQSYLNSHCIQEFSNWLGKKYFNKIKELENSLTSEFSHNYPDILNFPKAHANSIPFGIDDNRIYKIDGNIHSFKMRPKTSFIHFKIEDERYQDLINAGWTPRRGVLRLSKGKIILCLPLTKEVPDELKSTLVCGVDLGLKDGMVVSVYETDVPEEPIEVKRIFIDQKQLAGKKDEWFLPPVREVKPFNFKAKLFNLRYQARKLQSERMKFDQPRKHNTRAYWYLRREEKKKWQQISAIHKELVNQFATRLVAYCKHFEIGFIAFEDLKWSKHSLKSKVGPYLAHWQTHWFFSQIQQKSEEIAVQHGIVVKKVNAKDTSKKCHKCGKIGKRERKTFSCTIKKCAWKGDADLNAARNIALRGIKKYYQHLKELAKKQEDKLQKLHASEDGSRETEQSVTTNLNEDG